MCRHRPRDPTQDPSIQSCPLAPSYSTREMCRSLVAVLVRRGGIGPGFQIRARPDPRYVRPIWARKENELYQRRRVTPTFILGLGEDYYTAKCQCKMRRRHKKCEFAHMDHPSSLLLNTRLDFHLSASYLILLTTHERCFTCSLDELDTVDSMFCTLWRRQKVKVQNLSRARRMRGKCERSPIMQH